MVVAGKGIYWHANVLRLRWKSYVGSDVFYGQANCLLHFMLPDTSNFVYVVVILAVILN